MIGLFERVNLKKSLALDHCNGDFGNFIPFFKSGKVSGEFKFETTSSTGLTLSSI